MSLTLPETGTHFLSEPLVLGKEYSGTAGKPQRLQSDARLIGGAAIPVEWFEGSGPIISVNLAKHGLAKRLHPLQKRAGWGWNAPAPTELFYNGVALQLGRTEALYTGSMVASASFTFSGAASELAALRAAETPWFSGLFGTYWFNALLGGRVDGATITLDALPQYGIKGGMPFCAFNLRPRQAGEYFLDYATGVLYLWPPEPLKSDDLIYLSMIDHPLLRIEADHVILDGLTVEAGRGGLLDVTGNSVCVRNTTLRNAGTYGAVVSGKNSGLDRCRVYATGERGVTLRGGDRATLTAAGNYVTQTDLHHWGRWVGTSKVAIHLEGVGQRVSHNHLHEAPCGALWFTGNNHQIDQNEIDRVCRDTADAGAIYAGRDWSSRGTFIYRNWIHDLSSPYTPWQLFGVYLDDCFSGTLVKENLFERIGGFAMFNAGGRDNAWLDNTVIDCYGGHRSDRRGMAIIGAQADCFFIDKLNEAAGGDFHTNPAWIEAYPDLAALPHTEAELGDLKNPGGTIFRSNIGYGIPQSKWLSEGLWKGEYPGAFNWYWYANIENNPLVIHRPAFDTAGIGITAEGDFNRDGVVDLADYALLADTWGTMGSSLLCDANGDGIVDLADYTVWADSFEKEGQ